MIVRDEARFLPACLASVAGVVDEVVVVDTGSRDGTPEIARRHGARVLYRPWEDHFGAARNAALEQATGDWILVLDADEALHPDDRSALRRLLEHPTAEGFVCRVLSFLGPAPGDAFVTDPACRLFRNRPVYRYREAIHEEMGRVIARHAGRERLVPADVRILHYGYLDGVWSERQKDRRNRGILEAWLRRHPEDAAAHYCLGAEELLEGRYEQALASLLRAWQLLREDAGYRPDLLQKVALCYRQLGNLPAALRVLELAADLYPDFTDLHFHRGEVLRLAGDLEGAARAYRRALEVGEAPGRYTSVHGVGSFLAHYALGRICEEAYLFPEAARHHYQALSLNPRLQPALRRLLGALSEYRPEDEVARFVDERFVFDGVEQTLSLCESLASAGLARLAARYLEHHRPYGVADSTRYAFVEGLVRLGTGRPSEAAASFRRVPAGSPYHAKALLFLLARAWTEGNRDEAGRLLGAVEVAAPDRMPLYAAFHRHCGLGEAGDSRLDDALAAADDVAVLELVDALLAAGGQQLACLALRAAGQRPPDFYLTAARLLFRYGYAEEADRWLGSLDRDPRASRLRAWWLLRRGRVPEALALMAAAALRDPGDVAGHLALAQALLQRARHALEAAGASRPALRDVVTSILSSMLPEPPHPGHRPAAGVTAGP